MNQIFEGYMEIKPIARRHHYLPQAYLAAFTNNGCKDGKFFVLDAQTGLAFSTSPINVAVKRDFNRVDIEGRSPDAIESGLAPFEAEAVHAIRRVIESQMYPSDGDWNLILNLLALIAVRNPKIRDSFNHSRELVLRNIADLLVSDEYIWDHHIKKAREAGVNITDDVSFEDVRRFIKEGKYQFEFHPQDNLRVEFNSFDKLLPLLGQRSWSILVAPPEGPEFVASDHPVTLVWKSARSGAIGFEHKETEVFFPLGRRVGFYGVYEDPLNKVVTCKPSHVATLNSRVSWNSERHVYSTQKCFFIWYKGQIREVQCEV